jgi:hypothetical protein
MAPAASFHTLGSGVHMTLNGRGSRPLARVPVGARMLSIFAALAALAAFAPPALAKPSYLAGDRVLVNHYAAIEGAKLGVSLPGGAGNFIKITESPLHRLLEPGADGSTEEAEADTDCRDASGASAGAAAGCVLTISRGAHEEGEEERRSTIAHEVFHTFQAVMSGTLANFYRPGNSWLVEGSATWVESDLVHDSGSAREWWRRYLISPSVALFRRTYDGVGFFGHLASNGISPWSKFKAMFAATSNEVAYTVAVGGDTTLMSSGASAYFREPALGAEWDERGPNVPTAAEVDFKPTPEDVKSSEELLDVAPYANGAYRLSLKKMTAAKPVLEVRVSGAHVRVRSTSGGSVNEVEPGTLELCSHPGGCSCPSQPATRTDDFKEGNLAIAGGPTGGRVYLIPRTRCETLLPARSCENLLPGFAIPIAPTLEQASGQKLAIESGDPSIGDYTYVCLFPVAKGNATENSEGESVFDGVSAVDVYVKRFGTVAEAEREFMLPPGLPDQSFGPGPVSGVGDEAAISSAEETASNGEKMYASDAIVRVRNVIAGFSIISGGGDAEAGEQGALVLLAGVADQL